MAAVLVTHHGPHMSPLTISPREDCGSGETGSNLESVLIAVTVRKKDFYDFLICWANVVLSVFLRAQNQLCFSGLSLVQKIVLFGALPRAQNRASWCSPSCQKPCSRLCFLVLSFVPQIVLFVGALLRALLSFVQTSCPRSCFLVLSFVHKIVL